MAPKIATPLDSLPVGRLGIIPLKSCEKLGAKVNDYIVKWRKDRDHQEKNNLQFEGYERSSYLINAQTPRFGSGEAKGILEESVRGDDLYLMVDVCNYSLTYSLCGHTNHMSPDDHFQDLKRIIAAVGGKARRVNVIMPFLYESRQHKRKNVGNYKEYEDTENKNMEKFETVKQKIKNMQEEQEDVYKTIEPYENEYEEEPEKVETDKTQDILNQIKDYLTTEKNNLKNGEKND